MKIDTTIQKRDPLSVKAIKKELKKMVEHYDRMELKDIPDDKEEGVIWANEKIKFKMNIHLMVKHKNCILQFDRGC